MPSTCSKQLDSLFYTYIVSYTVHDGCLNHLPMTVNYFCPRLLFDVQTGSYKIQTQSLLSCVFDARPYGNYRCLRMYFLIQQEVQITFKNMFCLMFTAVCVFKYWWLKVLGINHDWAARASVATC